MQASTVGLDDNNSIPCSVCRRRKVKCDKVFPCSNCTRLRLPCSYEDRNGFQLSLASSAEAASPELFERLTRIEGVLESLNIKVTDLSIANNGQSAVFQGFNGGVSNAEEISQTAPNLPGPTIMFSARRPTDKTQFPSNEQAKLLLNLFLDIAEPLIGVLNVFSFTRDALLLRSGRPPEHFQPLYHCIIAVALITLPSQNFAEDMFNHPWADMRSDVQTAAENALHAADFLNSTNFMILQALLYFVTFIFQSQQYEKAHAYIGIALTQAIRLRLHRDPDHFNEMGPREGEFRRRAWHYLLHLDMRCKEELNTDFCLPMIADWDTRPPANVDDEKWDDPLTDHLGSQPLSVRGYTSMTFAVCRGLTCLLRHKLETHTPPSLAQRRELIDNCRRDIETGLLCNINPSNPLQKAVATFTRNRLFKVEVVARKEELPVPLDLVERFSASLAEIHEDGDTIRWHWLIPHKFR